MITTETRPLKICMIISSYHPIVGGAEKQVAQLAKIMVDQGHDLTILTTRYPGLDAEEMVDGVRVVRIPLGKRLGAISFIWGAAAAVRRIKPDVVHCHSLFSPALAGALAKRFMGMPLLAKPMCGGEAASIAEKPLGKQRHAYMGRNADTFLVVSREIEAELLELGFPHEKIKYVPNGVDGAKFHPAASADDKAQLRKDLGLPDGPLFLFAGRLAAQKRLPLLLKEWAHVLKAAPEARLLIAGANRNSGTGYEATFGEAEGVAQELLEQPGVQLLGHVSDMPPLLRAVDVFVLPSAREGLSNALLEASAAGLATVSAKIGGAADFIVDGENGLQFAVDDGPDLRKALIALAQDADKRANLGAAARQSVLTGFDINQTASRLLTEYRRLLSPPAATPTAQPGAAHD